MTGTNIAKLVGCIIVCLLAGGLGALFTSPAIPGWYATLNKPSFTPPSWLFGPVWTTLYVLMGVSFFLVWRHGLSTESARMAAVFFGIQLVLNALWSPAFFGLRSPLAGLVVIVPLWFAILMMILTFARVSMPAGCLQVPYLVWVSYASVLNAAIFVLNR